MMMTGEGVLITEAKAQEVIEEYGTVSGGMSQNVACIPGRAALDESTAERGEIHHAIEEMENVVPGHAALGEGTAQRGEMIHRAIKGMETAATEKDGALVGTTLVAVILGLQNGPSLQKDCPEIRVQKVLF